MITLGTPQNRGRVLSERSDASALLTTLDPSLEGDLWKRSRLGIWQRRYAELRGSALVLAHAQPSGSCGGGRVGSAKAYSLVGARVAALVVRDRPSKRRFVVQVETGARAFTLALSSADERAKWLDGLTRASRSLSLRNFELLGELGDGGYGRVFLARRRGTAEQVALKVVGLQAESNISHPVLERHALEQATGHPFLGGMYATFTHEGRLCYVLQLGATDLFEHMRRQGTLTVAEARFYAAELLLALEHLHARSIVHLDIKIENVLLQRDGHAQLIDFGLAKRLGPDGLVAGSVGTAHYMPPEMLQHLRYGAAVDLWQLGCFLYEAVAGRPPFYGVRGAALRNMILDREVAFSSRVRSRITPEYADLVRKLLAKNPAQRLGAGSEGLAEVKTHPFFKDVDWAALLAKRVPAPFVPESVSATSKAAPPGQAATPVAAAAAWEGERRWAAALASVPGSEYWTDRLLGFTAVLPEWDALGASASGEMSFMSRSSDGTEVGTGVGTEAEVRDGPTPPVGEGRKVVPAELYEVRAGAPGAPGAPGSGRVSAEELPGEETPAGAVEVVRMARAASKGAVDEGGEGVVAQRAVGPVMFPGRPSSASESTLAAAAAAAAAAGKGGEERQEEEKAGERKSGDSTASSRCSSPGMRCERWCSLSCTPKEFCPLPSATPIIELRCCEKKMTSPSHT